MVPEFYALSDLLRAIIRLKGIVPNDSYCSWDDRTPGTKPGERRR